MITELELQTEAPSVEVYERMALPVCPRPWRENPYGLVSLWDMLQLKAQPFLAALDLVTQLALGSHDKRIGAFEGQALAHVCEQLDTLERYLIDLELPMSVRSVVSLKAAIPNSTRLSDCEFLFNELRARISDEIGTTLLLRVPAAKARYYESHQPFGPEVANAFPSVSYDAIEAAHCLALNRGTACVFHLMRSLEIALAVMGGVFGVSLAHTNWGPAIEQIESKIREMHKDPTWKALPDCKEQQEFYAQAASHFGIVKDAWRNYTAHARSKYTEEEAELIFLSVRGFIQKLATRLRE